MAWSPGAAPGKLGFGDPPVQTASPDHARTNAVSPGQINRHYAMEYIHGRHFVQTAKRAGLPGTIAREALAEVAQEAESALMAIEEQLPSGFPEEIHAAVRSGLLSRVKTM